MRLTNLLAAAAALSVVATPAVAAPANPAAKLSLTDKNVRAGAPMKRANKAASNSLLLGGAAAVIVVIVAVALGKNDSKPASS